MQRGYVKLWRRSIDNGWLQNHLLWSFWCWCLLKASHKQKEITVGFQRVVLEPGQFVFGRNNAAKELRASPQNIRTCVQTLTKTQNLTIKSTNKFSIISIINWDSYQQDENKINHQVNKPLTSNQPATNHKQECKALKNEKNKEKIIVSAYTPPSGDELQSNGHAWIDAAAWDEWVEHLKQKKCKPTELAIKKQLALLFAHKSIHRNIIEKSITSNYQGLFAPKQNTFDCEHDGIRGKLLEAPDGD